MFQDYFLLFSQEIFATSYFYCRRSNSTHAGQIFTLKCTIISDINIENQLLL